MRDVIYIRCTAHTCGCWSLNPMLEGQQCDSPSREGHRAVAAGGRRSFGSTTMQMILRVSRGLEFPPTDSGPHRAITMLDLWQARPPRLDNAGASSFAIVNRMMSGRFHLGVSRRILMAPFEQIRVHACFCLCRQIGSVLAARPTALSPITTPTTGGLTLVLPFPGGCPGARLPANTLR